MNRISPNRRIALQAGILMTGVSLQAVGCGEVRYRDVVHAESTVQRVVFRGDVGIIEVVPASTAKVNLAIRAPDGAASVQHRLVDGVFEVTARCRTPILCAVDAEIHVPEGVPVEVELDRGEVWATGIRSMSVSVGEGDVDLDAFGPTTVQVGSGSARVTANSAENVRVAVGNGDIDVHVAHERWNVSLTAANESIDGVVDDQQARSSLELVAPAGSVQVRRTRIRVEDSGTP
jgi:hypothetical protein